MVFYFCPLGYPSSVAKVRVNLGIFIGIVLILIIIYPLSIVLVFVPAVLLFISIELEMVPIIFFLWLFRPSGETGSKGEFREFYRYTITVSTYILRPGQFDLALHSYHTLVTHT
jgi:hypothetical protein